MAEPIGGYQACADALSVLGREQVTRQQVYGWWSRRAIGRSPTGFPDGWERPSYNNATEIREFRIADVLEWAATSTTWADWLRKRQRNSNR